MWYQRIIELPQLGRGFHLVTDRILERLPEIARIEQGMLHLFIQHTSAGLTVNENADADVRADFETMMNRIVPEGQPIRHTLEGPDDMPAHIKSSLVGSFLLLPVTRGRLTLGTWQGIYLCEFRNRGGPRRIVCTLQGSEERLSE